MESEFVRVAGTTEIAIGKMKKVTSHDKEVLIANVGGNYYAVDSVCTHFGGDLSEGVLEGRIVMCPNHKSKFDISTGKVVSPPVEALDRPNIEDLQTYRVKIEKQDILIKITRVKE